MKRIKAVNGYTIYQATARDAANRNVEEGYFYLFFSSDIRDYGLSNCDWDWEAGSIEEAEAFATGTNYAAAKAIVEETTTAASFEEIAEVESKLDNGMTREEIEEENEKEIDTMTTNELKDILAGKLAAEGTYFTKDDIKATKKGNGFKVVIADYEHIPFAIHMEEDDYFGKIVYVTTPFEEDAITFRCSKKEYPLFEAILSLGYYIGTRF